MDAELKCPACRRLESQCKREFEAGLGACCGECAHGREDGLFGSTYLKASDTKTVPLVMEPGPLFAWTGPHVAEANNRYFKNESGPGISSHPEKTETLVFLDEDLLCEDE